ncbi:helix-hairpin-helix domain-containing protein [Chitinophaga sp. YIM B06452]|uniref:ComEA family DNA-binding protein n=1 Tax=Chitinophaga sp. YIM B06452 TaxID=3082158 RepID=UPI0031FF0411
MFLCIAVHAWAQEEEHPMEMRQEQSAGRETGNEEGQEQARENDEQYQELTAYTHRKLNLNTADAAALHGLGLLDALQVNTLLQYRERLGPLVSIYELQAVPGFELPLIRAMLPYVQAGSGLEPYYTLKDYFRKGKHQLEIRYSRGLELAEGYTRKDSGAVKYLGSPDKMLLRYRYRFGRYASWGLVVEKDAGEKWMGKRMPWVGDHIGFHLFLQRLRNVKVLALGDYTVNMGQGLVQWQGLSFGKSAAVMQVKRESEVLRPYASAGEFFFYRGGGITWEAGKNSVTGFISYRALDGRLSIVEDTASNGEAFEEGTLSSAGYHRTASELALRNTMRQYTAGAVIKRRIKQGHIALNVMGHQYSHSLKKGEELYRLYAMEGQRVYNASVDHAFGWRNIHVFGEAAVDGKGNPALLQGLLAALSSRVDLAMLYRYEHKAYRSMYGNSFGESSAPGNESGMYLGIQCKFGSKWLLAAYADVFRSPWLRYRVSAPAEGTDALLFMQWMPDKKSLLNVTYRYAQSPVDVKAPPLRQRFVDIERRHHISARAGLPVDQRVTWNGRMQAAFGKGTESWLLYQQVQARWGRWKLSGGYAWFDTAETDGLYLAALGFPGDQSLSRFSGRGHNGHAQLLYQVFTGLTIWCRWQRSVYPGSESNGTGLEKIAGSRKTSLQLQLQLSW